MIWVWVEKNRKQALRHRAIISTNPTRWVLTTHCVQALHLTDKPGLDYTPAFTYLTT